MGLYLAPVGAHVNLLKPISLRAGGVFNLNRYSVLEATPATGGCGDFISHITHATLCCHSSGESVDVIVAHQNGVKLCGTLLRAGERGTLPVGSQLRLPSRVDGKRGWSFHFVLRPLESVVNRPSVELPPPLKAANMEGILAAHVEVSDEVMAPHVEVSNGVLAPRKEASDGVVPPHVEGSNGVRAPRKEASDGMVPPHEEVSNGVVAPHEEVANGVVAPHEEVANGVVAPHVEAPNGVVEPHVQVSDGVLAPHVDVAEGAVAPHEELSEGVMAAHVEVSDGIVAPHAEASDGVVATHLEAEEDCRYDGGCVYLNALEGRPRSTCAGAMPELRRQALFEPRHRLEQALLTSFGTDYTLVGELLSGTPASRVRRGVVVVDHYEHHAHRAGLDEHTYTPANVGAYVSVVLPPFFADDASAAERARVHHGTMHPKLWLLRFGAGGGRQGFLRVVVSSANLGRYDASINNQTWACDFASSPAGGRGGGEGFGADLRRFVRALLASAPPIEASWAEALATYELTPPEGTHLIISVPGRYNLLASDGMAEAELYGQMALKRHLREAMAGREARHRPSRVEYALSSMGRLEDIMESLLGRLPGDGRGGVCRPDPKVRAPRSFLEGSTPQPNGMCADAWVVWPSLASTLPAFSRSSLQPGLLTAGGGKNTMQGPSDLRCAQLKQCLAHNVMSNPARRATLHHIKMAAGIVLHAEGGEGCGDGGERRHPLCAWVYAGSHNLSGAAWGKLEVTEDEKGEGADKFELVCMSYEVGVLLIPPVPRRFPLPWLSPAEKYDPQLVRPFSTTRYLDILRGKTPTAQDDVEAAAIDASRQWGRLYPHAAAPLPRALKLPLSRVRRLMVVEVAVAQCVVAYAAPPTPRSEARRAARHLHNGAGGGRDELMASTRCAAALAAGLRLEVTKVADFSYGAGQMKAEGDPILSVYELADGGGFIDDFDRTVRGGRGRRTPSLRVVDRTGPRGVLLAFLAEEEEANAPLLRALAEAREEVERVCWGVIFHQPDKLAGFTHAVAEREPPLTPSHSDLLALDCAVEPSTDLPALVLRTADLNDQLLTCKGAAALSALRQTSELPLKLRALAAEMESDGIEVTGVPGGRSALTIHPDRTGWYRHLHEKATGRAAEAAEWVRQQRFKLILIEPEGVLKKQCCIKLEPSAATAVARRRRSLFGSLKYDAFRPDCVLFLRALLLEHGDSGDTYDPESMYGDGPAAGTLRPDAPCVAMVTNFGHLVSKARPGESRLLEEAQVHETLANLVRRIASELGVSEASLLREGSEGKQPLMPPFISFRAPQRSEPFSSECDNATAATAPLSNHMVVDERGERDGRRVPDDAASHSPASHVTLEEGGAVAHRSSPEWSSEWCKPRPGMLLAAMEASGVSDPRDVLMIGADFVDLEAAFHAKVNYMPFQHLVQCTPSGTSFWQSFHPEHSLAYFVPAGGAEPQQTVAPKSFAARQSHADEDLLRTDVKRQKLTLPP
ncbi:hypothetical protein AB1Y20_006343 [Prymnesium parvum]|uniref:Uncharacterized protein n=1 Tax=Prymnesium parvum TaxID=97485 RepID=A0AB34J2G1_PRYPA